MGWDQEAGKYFTYVLQSYLANLTTQIYANYFDVVDLNGHCRHIRPGVGVLDLVDITATKICPILPPQPTLLPPVAELSRNFGGRPCNVVVNCKICPHITQTG